MVIKAAVNRLVFKLAVALIITTVREQHNQCPRSHHEGPGRAPPLAACKRIRQQLESRVRTSDRRHPVICLWQLRPGPDPARPARPDPDRVTRMTRAAPATPASRYILARASARGHALVTVTQPWMLRRGTASGEATPLGSRLRVRPTDRADGATAGRATQAY